ncbi:structural maintenance of chromosomes protein 2 [Tanacetum coccineum]
MGKVRSKAQQIIKNRDLRGRVTTIPLNRIKNKHVHPQVQKAAIDLTNAAAEKVAFDRRVKTRSVTLEGDLFQSGGLITGGSVRCVGDQLRQLHALGEAYSELSLHEKRLSKIEAMVKAVFVVVELKQQLEVKAFRLKQSQNTAEQNEHHKLSEIVKRIKQELEEAKSALTEKHAFYEESITKVANLVISDQDHANNEDGSLKTRAEKIEAVKKKMQSAKKNLKSSDKSAWTCHIAIARADATRVPLSLISSRDIKCDISVAQRKSVSRTYCCDPISRILRQLRTQSALRRITDASLSHSTAGHQTRGTSEQVSSHEKRVNKKVMSMFEKTENDYNDLISKKNIIETNKSKIKLVIEEVDAKKKRDTSSHMG